MPGKTRAIRDESRRAQVLTALAQVDTAYFAEALQAARAIQDEEWRAQALTALAQVDADYFAEALQAARAIRDESRRAQALAALVEQVPKIFLSNLWDDIAVLIHKPIRAKAFSAFLVHLSLATLNYSNW